MKWLIIVRSYLHISPFCGRVVWEKPISEKLLREISYTWFINIIAYDQKKNQLSSGVSFRAMQQTGTLLLCATNVDVKAAVHSRVRSQLYRGLSHLRGYIRRITYSRQRKGLLAHYAGDVRVAARWARRHHGQVVHDLQHFYPGQHRETSHRRNMATGHGKGRGGACGLHFLARPGWQAGSFLSFCVALCLGNSKRPGKCLPANKEYPLTWRPHLFRRRAASPRYRDHGIYLWRFLSAQCTDRKPIPAGRVSSRLSSRSDRRSYSLLKRISRLFGDGKPFLRPRVF